MITYFRFLLLTMEEKMQYLRKEGYYITIHSNVHTRVELYALSNFFVEVHYQKHENEVVEVVAFRSTDRLLQYAHPTSLSDLNISC